MKLLSKRELVTSVVVAVLLVLSGYFGITEALGAHPWWAFKVTYIGVIIGAVIYVAQSFWRGSYIFKRLFFALGLLAMSATVWQGKAWFVASYADDVFAGKMWFLGWIGIVVFLFLLAVHLIGRRN